MWPGCFDSAAAGGHNSYLHTPIIVVESAPIAAGGGGGDDCCSAGCQYCNNDDNDDGDDADARAGNVAAPGRSYGCLVLRVGGCGRSVARRQHGSNSAKPTLQNENVDKAPNLFDSFWYACSNEAEAGTEKLLEATLKMRGWRGREGE